MNLGGWALISAIFSSVLVSVAVATVYIRSRMPSFRAPADSDPTPMAVSAIIVRKGVVADITVDMSEGLGLDLNTSISWDDLKRTFDWRFPGFPEAQSSETLVLNAVGDGDNAVLKFESGQDTCRIELIDGQAAAPETHKRMRKSIDADLLTDVISGSSDPMWWVDEDGAVRWHNQAYSLLLRQYGNEALQTVVPGFDILVPEGEARRARLTSLTDNTDHWYEVSTVVKGGHKFGYATDINALVHAEVAQRNFVQTLAKTFAHLPIGLAIFDRKRQLALFNPALVDLTALPADFLSARPNLFAFFDHLRDARMMPEPKDYGNWRSQMSDLIRAAHDDRYCETWTLPSGLTYKVTGRPHPDGAIAFLFEDISAEISLTRRFRAELDQSQSALDSLDDAVAIFSQLGGLTMCNAAYKDLWRIDPDSSFNECTILDMSRQWQLSCDPSPIWSELRDFVVAENERSEWDGVVFHRSRGQFCCHVSPIKGGNSLVRFEAIPDAPNLQSGHNQLAVKITH